MDTVAKFFLRAKHWQIFLLVFGIFFVGMIAISIASVAFLPASPEEIFDRVAILDGILTVLFMVFFIGWLWSMGTFLTSIVNPPLRLRMVFFRFALLYPLLYMPAFIAVFNQLTTAPWLFAIIFPLHLLAVYCMFYLLYFVSKSLALAEKSKPVSFYDYSGPFFLLWFFPIGVWIIQPRVNRLYEARGNPEPASGDTVV